MYLVHEICGDTVVTTLSGYNFIFSAPSYFVNKLTNGFTKLSLIALSLKTKCDALQSDLVHRTL